MLCLNLNFWTFNSILMKSWNCKQISWMWTASGCGLGHHQPYWSNENKNWIEYKIWICFLLSSPSSNPLSSSQIKSKKESFELIGRRLFSPTNTFSYAKSIYNLKSAHHATSLVVVKIHQVSKLPRFLETLFVRAVNKSLGKIDSIPQVVTAMCHKITKVLKMLLE